MYVHRYNYGNAALVFPPRNPGSVCYMPVITDHFHYKSNTVESCVHNILHMYVYMSIIWTCNVHTGIL